MSAPRKCRRLAPDQHSARVPRDADAAPVHGPGNDLSARVPRDTDAAADLDAAWQRASEAERDEARAKLAAVRRAEG